MPVVDLAEHDLAVVGQHVQPLVQDDGIEGRHEPQLLEALQLLLRSADAHAGAFGQADGAKWTPMIDLTEELEAAVAWGDVAVDVHRLSSQWIRAEGNGLRGLRPVEEPCLGPLHFGQGRFLPGGPT